MRNQGLNLLIATIAAISIATAASQLTFAAEANENTSDNESSTTGKSATEPSTSKTANKNNKPTNEKDSAGEVFVPSEEISEDFAVSFPVDI